MVLLYISFEFKFTQSFLGKKKLIFYIRFIYFPFWLSKHRNIAKNNIIKI